jgi:hypothetical protein
MGRGDEIKVQNGQRKGDSNPHKEATISCTKITQADEIYYTVSQI